MTGKEKCKMLKEIRHKIAEKYGIPYDSTSCTYEGDNCLGTCTKCDAETVSIFNYIIEHRIKLSDDDFVNMSNKNDVMQSDEIDLDSETKGNVPIIEHRNYTVGYLMLERPEYISDYNPFDMHTDYIPSFEVDNEDDLHLSENQ